MVENQPLRQAVNMRTKRLSKYIVWLITLQILFAGAAAQPSAPSQSVPIKNFGKVNENYYRGSQPSAAQFEDLKRLGVKTIVDLREDKVEQAEKWARAAGLQYVNISLRPHRAATEEQSSYFLKLVNDPANQPVYVHCKGGRHRTGQMTAIYRITHDGWTADQAYQEMKKYDFEDSLFYPRAVKKHVFSYYERFNSAKDTSVSAP
jgi:protein tyrosine/serine phosphatase